MGSFQEQTPQDAAIDPNKPLTQADCRDYIDRATFRLRPPEYCEKYPKWPGAVGLEIEMLPVYERGDEALPGLVALQGETNSSAALLRAYAKQHGLHMEESKDPEGQPVLLYVHLDHGDNISFEPGGQVEFSSIPYPCLSDAVRRMQHVQSELDQMFATQGIRLVQLGINPWYAVADLPLQMRKPRYRAMHDFYSQIGPFGPRMMRQTCTIQVNLDFGPDERMLARRYLASMLLAPLAAASFSVSAVVDNQLQDIPGFRTRVWRHVSPAHTGLPGLEQVAKQQTRHACIETYFTFAMQAPVVFVTALDFKRPQPGISFSQWLEHGFEGTYPTLEDFKTHLTLLFPEVRPRGFLELRSVDCQPRAFQAVPAAYWTGLLYDDQTTDALIDLLYPHRASIDAWLVQAEAGLRHPEIGRLAKQVMDLAVTGFSRLPSCFKAGAGQQNLANFREHFTARGLTPGDDIIAQLRESNSPSLSYGALKKLEERWSRMMEA